MHALASCGVFLCALLHRGPHRPNRTGSMWPDHRTKPPNVPYQISELFFFRCFGDRENYQEFSGHIWRRILHRPCTVWPDLKEFRVLPQLQLGAVRRSACSGRVLAGRGLRREIAWNPWITAAIINYCRDKSIRNGSYQSMCMIIILLCFNGETNVRGSGIDR